MQSFKLLRLTRRAPTISAPVGPTAHNAAGTVILVSRAEALRMVVDGTLTVQHLKDALRARASRTLLSPSGDFSKADLLKPHADATKIFGEIDEATLPSISDMLGTHLTANLVAPPLQSSRAGVSVNRYVVSESPTGYSRSPVASDDPCMNRTLLATEESIKLGFPLAQNFSSAERAVIEYIKTLSATGHLKQDPIVEITMGVIQEGFQHVILRADCRSAFGTTYSFVITTSRDPIFNNDLIEDHSAMYKLRRLEAEKKGVSTSDKTFIDDCNIPPHYSARQPSEAANAAATYIAPFLAAEELNLTFERDPYTGNTTRVVQRNPINQAHGHSAKPLSPEEGSALMSRIAAVQIKYAMLGGEAHLGTMAGGDFLLENGSDADKGKIWWHTHRNPSFSKAFFMRGGLTYYAEASKTKPHDMHVASYQTLQLLLNAEYDIREGAILGDREGPMPWPVYTVDEVLNALQISLTAGSLTREDLQKVVADLTQHEVPDVIYSKKELTLRIHEIVGKLQQLLASSHV